MGVLLITIVIAALVNIHLAHLVSVDTITQPLRDRIQSAEMTVDAETGWLHERKFVIWASDLVSCPRCSGVWISVGTWSLVSGDWPWQWGRLGLVGWLATAGLQGAVLDHALHTSKVKEIALAPPEDKA